MVLLLPMCLIVAFYGLAPWIQRRICFLLGFIVIIIILRFCGFTTIDVAFCWVYGLALWIGGFNYFNYLFIFGHVWWTLAHARVY